VIFTSVLPEFGEENRRIKAKTLLPEGRSAPNTASESKAFNKAPFHYFHREEKEIFTGQKFSLLFCTSFSFSPVESGGQDRTDPLFSHSAPFFKTPSVEKIYPQAQAGRAFLSLFTLSTPSTTITIPLFFIFLSHILISSAKRGGKIPGQGHAVLLS